MKEVISAFDEYLYQHNLRFQATIIGGAALIVMNIVSRVTQDVDCLDPDIPVEIINASKEFARKHPQLYLAQDWLNNGPVDLKQHLPSGWKLRLQDIFQGKAIHFQTLGRPDLLKTKLFACCDRDLDFEDCIKLKPSKEELADALPWVIKQDTNPLWEKRVRLVFKNIEETLNHA